MSHCLENLPWSGLVTWHLIGLEALCFLSAESLYLLNFAVTQANSVNLEVPSNLNFDERDVAFGVG